MALQSQHRDVCARLEEVPFGTSADANNSLATFFKKDFLRIANVEAVLKERATEAIAPKADQIRTRVASLFRPEDVQLPLEDASFVQRVLQAEAAILCADVMDSLGAVARNFGDSRMANQVGFFTLLQRVMKPACKLHLGVVQAHDREASRLTDEFAKAASELRVVAKLLKDFDTKVGVATLFSQHVSEGSALHFDHLDKLCAFDGHALHRQLLGILTVPEDMAAGLRGARRSHQGLDARWLGGAPQGSRVLVAHRHHDELGGESIVQAVACRLRLAIGNGGELPIGREGRLGALS